MTTIPDNQNGDDTRWTIHNCLRSLAFMPNDPIKPILVVLLSALLYTLLPLVYIAIATITVAAQYLTQQREVFVAVVAAAVAVLGSAVGVVFVALVLTPIPAVHHGELSLSAFLNHSFCQICVGTLLLCKESDRLNGP